VFPAPGEVAVCEEPVAPPGAGEILCQAEVSLISTGTETTCLRGIADPGTNWADWLRFPFRPGYSMAARVISVGDGVTGISEGDRIGAWVEHQERFVIGAGDAHLVPDAVSAKRLRGWCWGRRRSLPSAAPACSSGSLSAWSASACSASSASSYWRVAGARSVIAIDSAPFRLDAARTRRDRHAPTGRR
jgi:hypothetical protein